MSDRLIDRDQRPEDQLDTHLRPQLLKEFVGQSKAKAESARVHRGGEGAQ